MFPEPEEIAASTRITRVLSPPVDGSEKDGSIDGSEVNEVKIWRMSLRGEPVGFGKKKEKKKGKSQKRAWTVLWKISFGRISPQRGDARVKFHSRTVPFQTSSTVK